MGTFDTVLTKCTECGSQVQFQSKGGDCNLDIYASHFVPIAVAGDCTTAWCEGCEKMVQAVCLPAGVEVRAIPIPEED